MREQVKTGRFESTLIFFLTSFTSLHVLSDVVSLSHTWTGKWARIGKCLKSRGKKIGKPWKNLMGSHRLDQTWDAVALLLPIRLKNYRQKVWVWFSRQGHIPPLQYVLLTEKEKEVGEQMRNGEMQTSEEEEGETEDKLVSPPPASLPPPAPLSQDCCARLQMDSDVLIYVLMIGLVCSLCSAMLRLDRKQDHSGTHRCSHTHTHTHTHTQHTHTHTHT